MEEIIHLTQILEQRIQPTKNLIVILDIKGKIIRLNSYAESILGYKIWEVQGKLWLDLLKQFIPESYCSKIMEFYEEALKTPPIPSFEIKIKTISGEERHIVWNIIPIRYPYEGNSEVLVIGQDITTTIFLEEQLRRIDPMSALGVLSSGIAHELRNPLSGVLLSAQMLAEEIKEDSPMVENLKDILTGVQRMDQYLNRLLDFANPSESKKRPFDMLHIANEALKIIIGQAKKSQIDIMISTEHDLPQAFADPDQIRQILVNLLVNGIEAVRGDGEIRIILRSVPCTSGKKSGKEVEVILEDTGTGIVKEDLPKIFYPFFTTKSRGTGLGLSIVYALIQKNKGTIDVESTLGKMTRFILRIPSV